MQLVVTYHWFKPNIDDTMDFLKYIYLHHHLRMRGGLLSEWCKSHIQQFRLKFGNTTRKSYTIEWKKWTMVLQLGGKLLRRLEIRYSFNNSSALLDCNLRTVKTYTILTLNNTYILKLLFIHIPIQFSENMLWLSRLQHKIPHNSLLENISCLIITAHKEDKTSFFLFVLFVTT